MKSKHTKTVSSIMIDYDNKTGPVLGQDWDMVRDVLVRRNLIVKIFNINSP